MARGPTPKWRPPWARGGCRSEARPDPGPRVDARVPSAGAPGRRSHGGGGLARLRWVGRDRPILGLVQGDPVARLPVVTDGRELRPLVAATALERAPFRRRDRACARRSSEGTLAGARGGDLPGPSRLAIYACLRGRCLAGCRPGLGRVQSAGRNRARAHRVCGRRSRLSGLGRVRLVPVGPHPILLVAAAPASMDP
jgi:hypothetical protein